MEEINHNEFFEFLSYWHSNLPLEYVNNSNAEFKEVSFFWAIGSYGDLRMVILGQMVWFRHRTLELELNLIHQHLTLVLLIFCNLLYLFSLWWTSYNITIPFIRKGWGIYRQSNILTTGATPFQNMSTKF